MKFLKWLDSWRNAEAHPHVAEWLSKHKLFQKIVIGTYNLPHTLKKKIESLDFLDDENRKKEEELKEKEKEKPIKLLNQSCKTEEKSKTKDKDD